MPPTTTNITEHHRSTFNALISGRHSNFALVSCFANGEPTAAIAAIGRAPNGDVTITPLYIAVAAGITLTDHNGITPAPLDDT